MALSQWRDQELIQLREVAGRIATVVHAGPDRRSALARLTAASENRDELANLLIEYSGQWFNECNGQSILVDPELYWLLTEPDLSSGTVQTETLEQGIAKRARGMLLIFILENLARGQRTPETPTEHSGLGEVPHRQRNTAAPLMNGKTANAQPAG